jgi:hypothetical protein
MGTGFLEQTGTVCPEIMLSHKPPSSARHEIMVKSAHEARDLS